MRQRRGVVVSYDGARGFGFIRSRAYTEDLFVHARDIQGGAMLRPGQRVRFDAEPAPEGLKAVRVLPGRRGLPPAWASALTLVVVLAAGTIGLVVAGLEPLPAWLIAINLVTLYVWFDDKRRSVRNRRRVPEMVLLGLSALGGSLGAWVGIGLVRHKRSKPGFQALLGLITIAQIAGGIYWFFGRGG